MAVTFVNIFIFAFFFPETRGLPLEEIAARFWDHVTVRFNPHLYVIVGEVATMENTLSASQYTVNYVEKKLALKLLIE